MADTASNNKKNNIDPRKLAILMEVAKEAEGKSMDQLIPLIMNTNKRMQDQNLSFTTDESNMMMDLLSRNMNQREKMQFEMVKKFMSNNNR